MILGKKSFLSIGLVLALLAGGCLSPEEETPIQPMVQELSEEAVVLGQTLYFYGQNFLTGGKDGVTQLNFVGTYDCDNGQSVSVDFSVTPLYDGKLTREEEEFDVLRWSRFGPFSVPFEGAQCAGVFRGQVKATNYLPNGLEISGESDILTLRVAPSVAIEELQPLHADCGAPALRGLGSMLYRLRVRAIGFAPARFRYTVTNINGSEGTTVFEHRASGPTDVLGEYEDVYLNPVRDDQKYYISVFRVEAFDSSGRAVETVLPLSVHRGIEFFYDGNFAVAEYYPPLPVSGCIPGSIHNRVTYSETDSETVQQSLSITVSRTWMQSHGTSSSSNWSEGYSEGITTSSSDTASASLTETEGTTDTYGVTYNHSDSNTIGYSSSDGENWGWNISEGITDETYRERLDEANHNYGVGGGVEFGGKAGGGIPLVASGETSMKVSITGEANWGGREAETEGQRHQQRRDQGISAGGHHDETQSFGSTTTESSGTSVSGSYSLSSSISNTRSHTDEEARSQSRTYNLGGSVSQEDVVSEGITEAEERTWVNSSTHTTLLSYSAFIPVDRYGVFYRQKIRMIRKGYVRTYDLCGRSSLQSEMLFNEWTWAPDLARGDSCVPNFPSSNLPPAQCLIPPCEN